MAFLETVLFVLCVAVFGVVILSHLFLVFVRKVAPRQRPAARAWRYQASCPQVSTAIEDGNDACLACGASQPDRCSSGHCQACVGTCDAGHCRSCSNCDRGHCTACTGECLGCGCCLECQAQWGCKCERDGKFLIG